VDYRAWVPCWNKYPYDGVLLPCARVVFVCHYQYLVYHEKRIKNFPLDDLFGQLLNGTCRLYWKWYQSVMALIACTSQIWIVGGYNYVGWCDTPDSVYWRPKLGLSMDANYVPFITGVWMPWVFFTLGGRPFFKPWNLYYLAPFFYPLCSMAGLTPEGSQFDAKQYDSKMQELL
jgi:hypothetical protein